MPAGDTDLDEFFAHGVSDGLPVVPPTRARVSQALEASGRAGSELIAEVPPNYGRATVEKIAVNAVMAGCRPEYVPVGIVSMSTFAHPGRYTYCIGEHEEVSPWPSLAVEHGFTPDDSTVAVLAADAPLTVYDQRSRTAPDVLATIAGSLAVVESHKMTHWGDTLVVLGPEHARTIADDGWDKARIRRFLWERLQRPVCELVPGRDGGDGLPEHVLRKFPQPETDTTPIPKFREPDNLKIVVAGGTAGRFSAIVPGWSFARGSRLVLRKIASP